MDRKENDIKFARNITVQNEIDPIITQSHTLCAIIHQRDSFPEISFILEGYAGSRIRISLERETTKIRVVFNRDNEVSCQLSYAVVRS